MGENMNNSLNFAKILKSAAAILTAFVLIPTLAISQAAQDQGQSPSGGVIKTESRIVLVDAVVTDKKGNYIHGLTQQDFKVYEDNKEQPISSFSSGTDAATQANAQKRYMILFFDNSSLAMPDQIQARSAAAKFVEANASPDHLIAVVDFGGTIIVRQNFTSNAELLKASVTNPQAAHVASNAPGTGSGQAITAASTAPQAPANPNASSFGSFGNIEQDFAARSMLLSVRTLARSMRDVPGRKMLILFSAGFPLDVQSTSELTATIDACNKSNVAVYPVDVRGLVAGSNISPARPRSSARAVAQSRNSSNATSGARRAAVSSSNSHPHLVTASYRVPDPQKPGGGGGAPSGGSGGSHPSGGGGSTGTGGTSGSSGGTKGGTGTTGTTGTTGRPGGQPINTINSNTSVYAPANQPRTILPNMMQGPPSAADNQQVLLALAAGTGGFAIYNTNDILGGLNKFAREQNEFYVLGYVPQSTPEGACHAIKVKMNKGGMEVRSRSGYCNVRPPNPLDGKPAEKELEAQAAGSQPGAIKGGLQAPFFYSAPGVARVDVNMEIPGDSIVFNKDKGKYHATVNVLGLAHKPDGSVGARFNDTLNIDLEKDDWKNFVKLPYHYQNQFDAVPGDYKLTVVLSSGSNSFGKFETPLRIDSFDGNKFTIGGVVLSTNLQKLGEIQTDVDSAILEDRTPLIIRGMQVNPAVNLTFHKTESLVVYSELYEPLLKSDNPPKLAAGYRVFEKASNKQILFSGALPMNDFIQKGNPIVPFGLKVPLQDLAPGDYRLVLLAVDGANNQAPQRAVDFTVAN
jgi:VWFA-related protein